MPVTLLRDVDLQTVKAELSRMLSEGIVSPNVRRLAEAAITGKDDNIVAIFNFVRDTFPYVPDPQDMERFISPNRVALDYFEGKIRGLDCDDFALLTGAMLGSIGYDVRIALLSTSNAEIDHAISQVSTDIGWLNVDASSKEPLGWYIPSGRTIYA